MPLRMSLSSSYAVAFPGPSWDSSFVPAEPRVCRVTIPAGNYYGWTLSSRVKRR